MDDYLERMTAAAERAVDLLSDIFNTLDEIRGDVENLSNRVDELAEPAGERVS